MTEPQASPPDEIWKQFHEVEAINAQQLEQDYQRIERYNATILNQVAGIEDLGYEFVGNLGRPDDTEMPDSSIFRSPPPWSQLYLHPDREDELFAQGEDPKMGDPFVVRGEVPERTERLLSNMLTSLGAEKDEELSSPAIELWKGNVGGEPIIITKHHQVERKILLDEETTSPVLTVIVSNPNRTSGFIDKARQAAEKYSKPETKVTLQEQDQGSAEDKRKTTTPKRRWLFPKRRIF